MNAPGAAALVPTVKPGVFVEWRAPNGTRRGPALVRESFVDSTSGFTWLGIEWKETEYLLREDQIVELPSNGQIRNRHLHFVDRFARFEDVD